eukprot:CAMPEP_0119111346 /NCGR_PEP_ID=MMETSP1180-20130426/35162_1 /TAXON_ID=3052 ORGANISM="Chlamydomonas cf sp, Strain CCMP681" /NCGR_SAMPLE_ID=MMETSP1180 /ASSEMBLY_ACC=CAM_ASM_000741 /LENGTH=53 /DNA_ID=CAMNT_0007098259 /DNA_START=137 /DNA_END=298 /DNA_ORIENTATION=-
MCLSGLTNQAPAHDNQHRMILSPAIAIIMPTLAYSEKYLEICALGQSAHQASH